MIYISFVYVCTIHRIFKKSFKQLLNIIKVGFQICSHGKNLFLNYVNNRHTCTHKQPTKNVSFGFRKHQSILIYQTIHFESFTRKQCFPYRTSVEENISIQCVCYNSRSFEIFRFKVKMHVRVGLGFWVKAKCPHLGSEPTGNALRGCLSKGS